MNIEEFKKIGFYPGIRVKLKQYRTPFVVSAVDFETGDVETNVCSYHNLSDVEKFIPPKDYSPCGSCGAIHHPKQNTLCNR